MNEAEVLRLLRERGALLEGHFLLSSGRHSDVYVEKARLLEDPRATVRLGEVMASWYEQVDVVLSPAVGALPLGFAVALAGGARFVYAERREGHLALRRGFRVGPGERALIVEDVVTTGASAGEVWSLAGEAGAERLGVAALVDRSATDPGFPLRALARVPAAAWPPDACPLCDRGIALRSPGSRHIDTDPRDARFD